jgi:hypothetical protein
MMLDQLQRQDLALSWKTENDTMEGNGSDLHQDKARRFRDAALPCLDDVYTLARYLFRNTGDAEDALQECYLRALRHFDTFRGPAIKPWLFAILRNEKDAPNGIKCGGARSYPVGAVSQSARPKDVCV